MFQFSGAPKTKGYKNRQVGKTQGGLPKTHKLYMEPDASNGSPKGPPSSNPHGGRREGEQGVTTEDRQQPAQLRVSTAGRRAAQAQFGQWAHAHPPGGRGEEGYLEGSGGICSSVGEVSMIRTSSRSM